MAMGVSALDISDVGLCRDNKQKVYSMEIFSSRRQENQVFRENAVFSWFFQQIPQKSFNFHEKYVILNAFRAKSSKNLRNTVLFNEELDFPDV